MADYIVYTDGSCLGNPGRGGWAAVFEKPGKKEMSGGFRLTTNNRMEILSVIKALEEIPPKSSVKIFTDSRLVCDAVNKEWLKGWKRKSWRKADGQPVKNIDLWKKFDALFVERSVQIIWLKGHNGTPQNERCDILAKAAAEKAEDRDFAYESENGN